jgi:hypothetical protein
MQKMMFNDKYGLTEAVLKGSKTQTRRIVSLPRTFKGIYVAGFRKCTNSVGEWFTDLYDEDECTIDGSYLKSKYEVGEVVAISQSYSTVCNGMMQKDSDSDLYENFRDAIIHDNSAGWYNKMFVRADLMPHQIQITNIRLEKLQDISDEDCIAEGIYKGQCGSIETHFMDAYYFKGNIQPYCTPRDAYAELIDMVSGKGTWESNPYVFVYEFKLIK